MKKVIGLAVAVALCGLVIGCQKAEGPAAPGAKPGAVAPTTPPPPPPPPPPAAPAPEQGGGQ